MKAYVMVGAPGAGKSTLATQLAENENAFVISGDEVRAELYGDLANQGNWEEINDRIEELVSEAVGTPVILDGTHYLSSYRKEAQALLRSYGYDEVEAVVVNPPLEDCIFRNANRHRGVPRHVVLNMHEKLQKSLEFIGTEGFSHVTWAV
jgi:predicted kinase